MFNFFKKKPTISFRCDVPGYEIGQPVRKASDIKPDWLIEQTKQAKKDGTQQFSSCPGMHDLYRSGYIIPAWEDFEIIATKEKVEIIIGIGQSFVCKPYEQMAYPVVKGITNIDPEEVLPSAYKLPCPWKVFTQPGYSAYVIPAMFHSPFLQELFLYPGINDYDKYHTINVMFSPIKECHIKIYAGTPLLQVIPYKREDITADVGLINQKELSIANFTYRTKAPGFYRKFLHNKKKYDITYF
jgi:hypothetical protein